MPCGCSGSRSCSAPCCTPSDSGCEQIPTSEGPMACSPDGHHPASARDDGIVLVQDLVGGRTSHLRLMPLTRLAWSTAGIAVGGSTGVIVLDLNHNRPPSGRR